ncbi:MAG TPA: hypothetical protein DHN33_11605, partial [Eubacteriaceae bacterium]|nr:hypothetical protein [Eubacteriaceae bacterium]
LRRLDPDMEIIILDKGEYISFANCGLPYHLGGVAKKRESIIIHTPDSMKEKYNIDVRIQNEVTEIDRQGKSLTVKNHATGESYRESYDTLVVSTGSSPLVPPIPGIDGRGIFTLWTIPDMDRIKAYMEENKPKTVTIIGGGFVGLEVAENLAHVGMNVTVVEMASQVMAPIDPEMAEYVHENLRNEGVRLILGDGVSSFESKKGGIEVKTQNEQVLPSDMVILSIGVRPNTRILKEAGIELNERGFVKVDSLLKTSDKDIYALGDIIETDDIVTGGKTSVPLAGPAN